MKGKKDVNKTVKHCGVCQENFGDRFSFCPVCGEPLRTVEVGQNEAFAAAPTRDNAQIQREEAVAATIAPLIAENAPQFVSQKASGTTNGASNSQEPQPKRISDSETKFKPNLSKSAQPVNSGRVKSGDGLYHLTMLQPSPTYGRYLSYGALLGLFILMTSGISLMIVDIYNYNLDIEAPDVVSVLGNIATDDPEPVEVEKVIPIKSKDEGGGGGGGGRNDPKPASAGAQAPQRPEPAMITPSVNLPRLDNPSLRIQATTQGPVPTKRVENAPYGITGGGIDPSDGPGRGLGQGNGNGTGQGNGRGTGIGNGNGSGIGNGDGNGIGNGRGDGGEAPPAPKPPPAVTEKLAILSKPRANYTEEARKNQISGTVVVSVTFSASGQVTGISAVRGLPYGLTDQAIAAARQIKFNPQKQNGQAISVTRKIEYNFNLY